MNPTTATPAVATRRVALRLPAIPWDAVTAWTLSFALILYLALRGGGFDAVVRGQVGVMAWWVIMLVAVAGLLPRLTKVGWIALGVLAAFCAWTALGISGSESHERTLAEVGRLSAYVAILGLALTLQGRAGSRHVLNGVACAIGVVAVLAALSRLHPQWFPHNDQQEFLPSDARRLSYPLNYWNALSGFMAMGTVLLLGVAATARTRLGQGLAAAVVPLTALVSYLAISRGGAIVFAVALLVYLALAWDRLAKLATLAVTGGAAALLIAAADQRPAVQTGIDTAAARSQGRDLIILCLIVCAGTGALQVAIGLIGRHAQRPRALRVPRRTATVATALGAVACVAVFFGSGLNHSVADRWTEFKRPPNAVNYPSSQSVFARLSSGQGLGRYQYWQGAKDAYHSDPARGIGAGAYEFFWARHATIGGSIVDAHSLYAQTLAETGWVGLALLLAFALGSLVAGAVRALRTAGQERTLVAAATAAAAAFWIQAAAEWTWQIAVMPVAVFFLIAVIVGPRDPERRPARVPARALVVGAAIVGFIPVALALSTVVQVRSSQHEVRNGNLTAALNDARQADALAGTSATAKLQEALVYEQLGRLEDAAGAAIQATAMEPTNWRTWLVRSRIELELGQDQQAVAHFRKARRLNPRSPLFQG